MELRATPGAAGRAHGIARRAGDPRPRGSRDPAWIAIGAAPWIAGARDGEGVVGAVVAAGEPDPAEREIRVPWVRFGDADVILSGEGLTVDGSRGCLELDGVEPVRVVTVFLRREDGRVLLLRRSESVGSFRGRWAAISGYLEDPTPLEQARREVREETGIDLGDAEPEGSASPVYARDGSRVFEVHPFRFVVTTPTVRLDWEHTELDWVLPEELDRRPTVPKLAGVWRALERPPHEGRSRAKGV